MGHWIDLTHPLYDNMPVWPGDRPVQVSDEMTMLGDGCSVQRLAMGNHVGTHIDAPSHFLPSGLTVDQLSLHACVGTARLVFLPKEPGQIITRQDLENTQGLSESVKRIILRTGWDTRFGTPDFYNDFPVLTKEASDYLAGLDIVLLGMDTPSPSPIDDPGQAIHKTLLGAGIVLVESMANLHHFPAGDIDICILPLPVQQASGAPCRAIGRCCRY
jgi:kynurenine formamidase